MLKERIFISFTILAFDIWSSLYILHLFKSKWIELKASNVKKRWCHMIILIWWFDAQETFIIIINVENSCDPFW